MTDRTETFEVFNRRRTIGVSAAHGGAIRGVYLSEEVRATNERELSKEILAVAAVAGMRGRLSVREEMERTAERHHSAVPPGAFEALPKVPTAEQYEAYKRRVLKY